MISIAIAEDHHLLRTALVNLIDDEDDFEVVFNVANGVKMMQKLQFHNLPDVLLIDFEMPEMDGPSTVLEVRTAFGDDIKILGLSIYNELKMAKEMIQNGANGYVCKSVTSSELFEAIRGVYTHGFFVSSDIAKYLEITDNPLYKDEALSDVEEMILKLLCQEKNNEEIAEALHLSRNTINTYRTRMIEKLKVKNSIGLVIYAIQRGIHRLNR